MVASDRYTARRAQPPMSSYPAGDSATVATRARRALRPKWRAWFLALVAAFVMIGVPVAYAAWSSSETLPAVVTSGDFDMKLGSLTWQCADGCSSGDTSDLADFTPLPDQPLVVRQEIVPAFTGNNLAVALDVQFADMPTSVTGSWHLEIGDSAGADVPLGTPIVVADVASKMTDPWTVVITLEMTPDGLLWVDPTVAADAGSFGIGSLTISANQVRCGDGFAVACQTDGGGQP